MKPLKKQWSHGAFFLSKAVSVVTNLLDPDVIVIGGVEILIYYIRMDQLL